MNRFSNVRLEVPFTEGSCGCLPLRVPFVAICNKDACSMEWTKYVADKLASDVCFAVVLLDMLEVDGVVDDVHAEVGDCHLVSWPISFIERIPSYTAGSTVCLQLVGIASERPSRGARNSFWAVC